MIQVNQALLSTGQCLFFVKSQISGHVLVQGRHASSFSQQDLVAGTVSFEVHEDVAPGGKSGFGFTIVIGNLNSAQIVFMVSVTSATNLATVPYLNHGGAVPQVQYMPIPANLAIAPKPAMKYNNVYLQNPQGGILYLTSSMLRAKRGSMRDSDMWQYSVHHMNSGHVLLNGQVAHLFTQADVSSGSVAFAHFGAGHAASSHARAGFRFSVTYQEVEYTQQDFVISVSTLTMTGATVQQVIAQHHGLYIASVAVVSPNPLCCCRGTTDITCGSSGTTGWFGNNHFRHAWISQ